MSHMYTYITGGIKPATMNIKCSLTWSLKPNIMVLNLPPVSYTHLGYGKMQYGKPLIFFSVSAVAVRYRGNITAVITM